MHKKIFALLTFVSIFSFSLSAQSPEDLINSFFKTYQEKNINVAVKNLLSTNKFLSSDTIIASNWEKRFIKFTQNKGEYCGFELIEKEETSISFNTLSYLLKFEKAPVRIVFIMYKPKDKWQVNAMQTGLNQNANRLRR